MEQIIEKNYLTLESTLTLVECYVISIRPSNHISSIHAILNSNLSSTIRNLDNAKEALEIFAKGSFRRYKNTSRSTIFSNFFNENNSLLKLNF